MYSFVALGGAGAILVWGGKGSNKYREMRENRDYAGGFASKLMLKDLGLAATVSLTVGGEAHAGRQGAILALTGVRGYGGVGTITVRGGAVGRDVGRAHGAESLHIDE